MMSCHFDGTAGSQGKGKGEAGRGRKIPEYTAKLSFIRNVCTFIGYAYLEMR